MQIRLEKTTNEESHSVGSISSSVYLQYFKAGGSCASLFFFSLICVAFQFCYSFSHYWLSTWTKAEQLRATPTQPALHSTENNNATVAKGLDILLEMDTYTGVYGFTILAVSGFVLSMARSIHFFIIFLKASIRLHDTMFQSIVRSPLLFFDRNPIGIIQLIIDVNCQLSSSITSTQQ